MLRHLLFKCFLFYRFLSLVFVLVNVAWHLSVVLVRPRNIDLFFLCLLRRLQLKDSLIHVVLYKVLGLSLLQLVNICRFRNRLLGCSILHLILAALARQDLPARVLGCTILHAARTCHTCEDRRLPLLRLRLRGLGICTYLIFTVLDNNWLWLLDVVDALRDGLRWQTSMRGLPHGASGRQGLLIRSGAHRRLLAPLHLDVLHLDRLVLVLHLSRLPYPTPVFTFLLHA